MCGFNPFQGICPSAAHLVIAQHCRQSSFNPFQGICPSAARWRRRRPRGRSGVSIPSRESALLRRGRHLDSSCRPAVSIPSRESALLRQPGQKRRQPKLGGFNPFQGICPSAAHPPHWTPALYDRSSYEGPTVAGRPYRGFHVPHRQAALGELASLRRERGTISAEPQISADLCSSKDVSATCVPLCVTTLQPRLHWRSTQPQLFLA
jgi:hypothetical protein